jgi:hypothetical protein
MSRTPPALLNDLIGPKPQRGVIRAAWAAPVEVGGDVEVAGQAGVSAERARSCGGASLRDFGEILGLSFDYLIRAQQQRRRDGEAEGLRGLGIDDEVELGGLLDG